DTWTQTLLLHPHLHCLVTGGGLNASGQWVGVGKGFLLPMRGGMALFRGKLLAAIREGLQHGQLTLPPGKRRQQVGDLLNKLGRQPGDGQLPESDAYGQGVLIYLARYLRGGPIANSRLVACDGQQVVFRYEERAKAKGGPAKPRTMRLPLEQFLGRWLLHIPPARAVRVRCWGLYAHTQRDDLALCRQQVGQGPAQAAGGVAGPREEGGGVEEPLEYCPVCGQRLVRMTVLPRAGVPPPVEAGQQAAA